MVVVPFKVTFRRIFLSLLQLHLVEDTICCSTQLAWHLKCHLDQRAIEHPPSTEADVISKGELPQVKDVADTLSWITGVFAESPVKDCRCSFTCSLYFLYTPSEEAVTDAISAILLLKSSTCGPWSLEKDEWVWVLSRDGTDSIFQLSKPRLASAPRGRRKNHFPAFL